jgi:glycosyltransferase involved in cell wall biosynthesis
MTQAIHILTIADLCWLNGHEYALQAMQILNRQGLALEYKIVGQGKFLDAVGFARYELGLMDCVQVILSATLDEREHLYRWADLFLLAAVGLGGEHALIEAMQRGLPVVCTDVPELAEEVSTYPKGQIVPRRDPAALAQSIRYLLPGLESV